jgi:hypothetical protein
VALGYYLSLALARADARAGFDLARRLVPRLALLAVAGLWVALNVYAAGPRETAAEWYAEVALGGLGVGLAAAAGTRPSGKALWVACFLAAAGLAQEVGQDLVPRLGYQRSHLHQSAEVTALLRDPGVTVACWGRPSWGSLPFYLDRNDVRHLGTAHPREVRRLLRERAPALLVTAPETDCATVCAVLPVNRQLARAWAGRKANYFLIR